MLLQGMTGNKARCQLHRLLTPEKGHKGLKKNFLLQKWGWY